MVQAKIVYFFVGLFIAVSANELDEVGIKRSAVCLIGRVAKQNHINANFTKVSLTQIYGKTDFKCKLTLGIEEYTDNGSSFAKAKEKAAREAYAKTKYAKPALGNRTCVMSTAPSIKSDISLLEEYGHAINASAGYEDKTQIAAHKFECSVTFDGQTASGIGETKKKAKQLAATALIDIIGRTKIIDELMAKYNRTQYHNDNPVKRLRKIMSVSDLEEDAAYSKIRERTETKDGKEVKIIVAQVIAKGLMVTGSGPTYEEACNNAAAKLLRNLKYIVHPAIPQD